jgi:hypothetical protein
VPGPEVPELAAAAEVVETVPDVEEPTPALVVAPLDTFKQSCALHVSPVQQLLLTQLSPAAEQTALVVDPVVEELELPQAARATIAMTEIERVTDPSIAMV